MARSLLRVATAGSVDDGKSTLLGRLLYDAKGVLADQMDAVAAASRRRGAGLDLSLLTDGLRAEREQGITIDVAYRYLASPHRTFVLADTPGHEQYTRNMVTGASTADAAVVLLDVRHGLTGQSRRHAAIAALLRVPHLVLVVNKLDLVDWDRSTFDRVADAFRRYVAGFGYADVPAIPVSALHGDNVVTPSARAPWYAGPTLLGLLESLPGGADDPGTTGTDPATPAPAATLTGPAPATAAAHSAASAAPVASEAPAVPAAPESSVAGFRFPVQYVVRAPERDYRGYAGRVAGGTVRPGDDVIVLPSGRRTSVEAVETYDGSLPSAGTGRSVVLRLADQVDVGRGDLIVAADGAPTPTRDIEATVCWLAEAPLVPGRYLLRHATRITRAVVDAVTGVLEVTSGTLGPGDGLRLNDIGRLRLRTADPVPFDDYAQNRRTGAFILIDESSGATVAAGMAGPLPWAATRTVPAGSAPG